MGQYSVQIRAPNGSLLNANQHPAVLWNAHEVPLVLQYYVVTNVGPLTTYSKNTIFIRQLECILLGLTVLYYGFFCSWPVSLTMPRIGVARMVFWGGLEVEF